MTEFDGHKRTREEAHLESTFVNFSVEGRYFSIDISDIEEHPESYISAACKKAWRNNCTSDVVTINRSSALFRYVVDYHMFGKLILPKSLITMETIVSIQSEADFYNLPGLIDSCNNLIVEQIKEHRCMVENVKSYADSNLLSSWSACWEPACLIDDLAVDHNSVWKLKLYRNSTMTALNLTELLQNAQATTNGKCIDAGLLNKDLLGGCKSIPSLCRFPFNATYHMQYHQMWTIKLTRLVIVEAGEALIIDSNGVHAPTDTFFGTCVWTLNSYFEGGAVEVPTPYTANATAAFASSDNTNNQPCTLSRANQWLTMRKDCTITTHPVTAGTQVVLLGEIHIIGSLDQDDPTSFYGNEFVQFDTHLPSAPVVDESTLTYRFANMNGAFVVTNANDRDDPALDEYNEYTRTTSAGLQGLLAPLHPDTLIAQRLVSSLDTELSHYDDVVICLSKLYSLTNVVEVGELQGGDKLLFDLLVHYTAEKEVRQEVHQESDYTDGIVHCGKNGCAPFCMTHNTTKVNARVYDVSFVLVQVDRHMRYKGDGCDDADAYMPCTQFGTKEPTTRTTSLIVPINVTSEVAWDSHRRDVRSHLLTGLKVTKRVI